MTTLNQRKPSPEQLILSEMEYGRKAWEVTQHTREKFRQSFWQEFAATACASLQSLSVFASLDALPADWEWAIEPAAGAMRTVHIQVPGLAPILTRLAYYRTANNRGRWQMEGWSPLGLGSQRYAIVRHLFDIVAGDVMVRPSGEWWYVNDKAMAIAAAEEAEIERQQLTGEASIRVFRDY